MLLAVLPVPTVDVLVGVGEHALAVSFSVHEVAWLK